MTTMDSSTMPLLIGVIPNLGYLVVALSGTIVLGLTVLLFWAEARNPLAADWMADAPYRRGVIHSLTGLGTQSKDARWQAGARAGRTLQRRAMRHDVTWTGRDEAVVRSHLCDASIRRALLDAARVEHDIALHDAVIDLLNNPPAARTVHLTK
jgi:hypothetical protein